MNLFKFWLFPIWILMVIAEHAVSSRETDDLVSTSVVEAVVGHSASLPCNITTEARDDRVYMVLWFRSAGGKPLYSFDVRGRSFNKALHWSDPQSFGNRTKFTADSKPQALLTISKVEPDDEGVYRCRVDFKTTPTRNFQIKLSVIVAPHQLVVYEGAARALAGVLGPLRRGDNATLRCEARGGHPQPTLTWQFNRTPLDGTIVRVEPDVIVSEVVLTNAQRSWLNSTIHCLANNTRLVSPYQRSARIEMTLHPTSAELVTKPSKMFADKEMTLVCAVHGSRPPAEISWLRNNRLYSDGRQHKAYRRSEYINDTSVVSRLTFKPQPEDHNVTMKCRGDNVLLGVFLEDSFLMHVVYKPVVNLTLGNTLHPNEIKEGDDVYFECSVRANPREYRISWYHDGSSIQSNGAGIFTSTKSLVLQRVDRSHVGRYSCAVANEIGETKSKDVFLSIQYAPVCVQPSPQLVGARIDEPLRIRCVVRAHPPAASFTWLFNNSGESFLVSPHRYSSTVLAPHGASASEMKYCASSERDYGTLTCLSRNAVGAQRAPCVFQIVPAIRPSPPRNCSALKVPQQPAPLLAVRCLVGYDGGIRQHFTLETTGLPAVLLVNTTANYQSIDEVVWLNVSWSELAVALSGEDQGLQVVARNARGASEPVVLRGLVFRDPGTSVGVRVAETEVPVAVCLISLVALVAAAGAAVAFLCKRLRRRETTSAVPGVGKRPSQSVVRVDSQGRPYVDTGTDKDAKPDVLLPKTESSSRTKLTGCCNCKRRMRRVSRHVIPRTRVVSGREVRV